MSHLDPLSDVELEMLDPDCVLRQTENEYMIRDYVRGSLSRLRVGWQSHALVPILLGKVWVLRLTEAMDCSRT